MRMLGTIDLEILHLAMAKKNETFDERDIEASNLKRLGVGRVLDALASLKDREMISLNADGSFSVTSLAKDILWSSNIPTQTKILRLLQIRSCSIKQIADILKMPENKLVDEIKTLQKNQMILTSPQIRNEKIVDIYEILSEETADNSIIHQKGNKTDAPN